MMMITEHVYLDKYPILPESKRLIVGTIHPHDPDRFEVPFFYGNVNSLWNILSDAFPDDLRKPVTLEGILGFLRKHRISVSDTIRKCRRLSSSALDEDLVPLELNHSLMGQIRNSSIDHILFTSGFSKNSAFRLFYKDILGERSIPSRVRRDRKLLLGPEVFGRPVQLTVLYSPSGAANTGLVKSAAYLEQKDKYAGSSRPVYDFKVDYYRKMFQTS